jgi:hypothetical protein
LGHPIFEEFENAGLLIGRRVDTRKISRLSVGRLLDLSSEAAQLTSPDFERPADNRYAHAASLALGGGATPCETLTCRQKRVDGLARFAALYSDRVYIHNFVSDYANHVERSDDLDVAGLRSSFADDLKLLAHIRPLIDAGRIVPLAMPSGKCPHCTVEDSYGADAASRSQTVARSLEQRYLTDVTVTLQKLPEGELDLNWDGPEELLEHGGGGSTLECLPEAMEADESLRASLDDGETIVLTQAQVRLLGEHSSFVASVLRSISFEISVSQTLNASFLTDRALEVEVLNAISSDADIASRNRIVERYLTALVPFVADVPVARLLDLREREEESFVSFRRALNHAIDEYRRQGSTFREVDARALYGDVLAPQLATLDQKVQTAKRGLAAQIARDVAGWTAAISFGIYAGWVPAGIAAAAATLGLAKVGASLLSDGLKARERDATVRNEEYYFLWKVQGAAKQSAHRRNV